MSLTASLINIAQRVFSTAATLLCCTAATSIELARHEDKTSYVYNRLLRRRWKPLLEPCRPHFYLNRARTANAVHLINCVTTC
jgi:hypothetical protein